MKTPTPSAIETAINNAARDSKNYILNDTLAAEGLWWALHKSGDRSRQYMVDVNRGTCSCVQFAEQGVCKHQRMVDEELEIRAMEAEFEAAEEGRFFMQECVSLQLAEVAGAWGG